MVEVDRKHIHRLTLSAKPDPTAEDKKLAKKLSFDYFDQFDSNGDNLMSFKDVEAMLNHIYYKNEEKGVSKAAVKKFIKRIDNSNNGKIGKD
jgi:Ca2+-binding EF-hand superfamily protein